METGRFSGNNHAWRMPIHFHKDAGGCLNRVLPVKLPLNNTGIKYAEYFKLRVFGKIGFERIV